MSNKHSILLVTDYSAPYEGNFIESIKFLHKNINENNDRIVYLFPKRAEKLDWIQNLIKSKEYVIYFFDDDTYFSLRKTIKYIIKKENITAMYSHFCRHKTQLAVKVTRMLNHKIKLVSHFHNHCKVDGNFIKRSFMKVAYKLYEGDLNIGCSESVMNSMPYKKSKTTYVDNAINFSRLDNYRDISIPKSSDNSFVVLMFGFDYYRKGVDLAIKAIEKLNNPNIVLAISLASNKEKAENNIKKEFGKVPDFITFLDPINDIATYYHKADLFLSAAREEGFCYSIVEAAYCKTKVLSSNIPGVPKDIPGEYVFENENYEDLAEKINMLYNDTKSNNLNEAVEFVKKEYDISQWADRIRTKINECIETKNSFKSKNVYYNIILLVVAIIFVLLNSIGTLVYKLNNNVDACIFNTIGKYWNEGYIPYISLFDHKGPIIFFINMLSWRIFNCERGILFFQIMAVYISLVLLMNIAKLELINVKKSLLFTLLTLTYLTITYFGGNMTEEYCLPFLIGCMYLNLKFFKSHMLDKKAIHNPKYALLYGISFAVCFLTRLTNAVSVCVGVLVIGIILLKEKKFKNISKNFLYFLIGFLMCTLPFAIYFHVNNAFYEFINGTLLFNFKYATKSASWIYKENLLVQVIKFLLYFFPSYLLSIVGIRKIKKSQKEIGIYYILIAIMEVLLFVSNRMFRHYGMIVLPNFLLILVELEMSEIKTIIKRIIYVIVVVVGIASCAYFIKAQMTNPLVKTNKYDEIMLGLNQEDKESFIMWGAGVGVYEHYNIRPYYKYFVTQQWHASFSKDVEKKVHDTFYNGDVRWILFTNGTKDLVIEDAINDRYELVKESNGMSLYRLKESSR